MQPIRILYASLDIIAEIDDYESMYFTRSWHDIGVIELRINRYKKHADKLLKGYYLSVGNQTNKVFSIKHREIELDENGKITENWVIRGFSLDAIIGQRITLPPSHTAYDNKQGSAEVVMKHYVDGNIVNPVDVNRKIQQLVIAENLNRGDTVSWQSRFKNVAEETSEISSISGIGWGVTLDIQQKKFLFDVYEGRNLSVNQSDNPPVIFSPQFESLESLQYVESELNYKNSAYVAGQGEGVDRMVVTLGEYEGLNRHEVFIDARDIEDSSRLTERGHQKLQEFLQEQYLEGQIITPIKRIEYEREHHFASPFQPVEKITQRTRVLGSFIYEEDYDLGDIVTLQNSDWGVTLDSRITEIKEIYETNGFKLEATFGNKRPTLINRIKQQFSQIGAEVRR